MVSEKQRRERLPAALRARRAGFQEGEWVEGRRGELRSHKQSRPSAGPRGPECWGWQREGQSLWAFAVEKQREGRRSAAPTTRAASGHPFPPVPALSPSPRLTGGETEPQRGRHSRWCTQRGSWDLNLVRLITEPRGHTKTDCAVWLPFKEDPPNHHAQKPL